MVKLAVHKGVFTAAGVTFETEVELAGVGHVLFALSAPSQAGRQVARPRHALGQT